MANKEITLSARLDDSALVQDFGRVQQKIRQMMEQEQRLATGMKINGNLVNNGMSPMGQYSQQDYQKVYNQNNNSMRQVYAQEVANLSRIEKIRDSLTKKLERQSKIQSDMISQGKEISQIEESRALTAERLQRANENITRQQSLLNGSGKLLRQDMKPGEAMGPPAPPEGGGSGLMSSVLSSIASVVSAATVVRYASEVADEYARRPVNLLRSQGSAVSGTTGRALSQMQSGEYAYEGMFGDERQRAAAAAATSESRTRKTDMVSGIGGLAAAGIGLGALALAPLTGGLSLGAGALALGTAGIGGTLAYNKRKALFDRESYNADRASQYGEDFNSSLQSEKDLAPFKKDAIDKLKANGSGWLSSQRMMGLSDRDLFGMTQNLGYSGFTDQQGLGASQSILSAGGSTSMSRNADYGLKAERGLNLTNANQILGQLSGTQGIPETSKKTLIDIFAQAQSIGLDSSKFAEENRKFIQNVAESVNKSGTRSEDSGESIARMMANFTGGDNTMRGIQAGKSAYDAYQNTGSTTSGYQGALNAASLLKSDKRIGKLSDPAQIQYLMNLQPDELDAADPAIRGLAQTAGMSPSELVNTVRGSKAGAAGKGLFRADAFSKLQTTLKKYADSNGGSLGGFMEQQDLAIPGLAEMQAQSGVKGNLESRNYVIGAAANAAGLSSNDLTATKNKASMDLESKSTGRSMDTILQSAAMNAQTSLQTLSDSINKFATDSIASAQKMRDVTVPNDRSAHNDLQGALTAQANAQARYDNMMSKAGPTAAQDAYRELLDANSKASKMQETAGAADRAVTNRQ